MYSRALRPGERVKKCSNCTKDLPEAALHCVFCGAKQAASPAAQSPHAKTAFGYSANEVMQQLGNQAPPQQQQNYQRPQPASQPPPTGGAPYQPPGGGYQPPGGLANSNAQAKTMMAAPGMGPGPAGGGYQPPAAAPYGGNQPYGQPAGGGYQQPPGGGYQQPPGGGYQQPPGGGYQQPGGYGAPSPGGGMGVHSPNQMTPQPLPAAPAPYGMTNRGSSRAGRPVEPWKDALPMQMFIWGGVALVSFATPLAFDPKMQFNWDAIIHAPGKAKIVPLIWATVGLLSIVFGAIPMQTIARGMLAGIMGLVGIVVPLVLDGHLGDRWQQVLMLVGGICLVPGLLVRHEYTESMLARMLVTVGVLLSLVPYLVPDHGQIPLVMLFKALIEAGSHMEIVIVQLAHLVLLVVCLLVWMPGPATGGAKIFAWLVIVFPIIAAVLFGLENIDKILTKTPGAFLAMWAPAVVYSVLLGYGGATVIGKQLE
jgi:hypothetical protein